MKQPVPLAGSLRDALGSAAEPERSERAQAWCLEVGLPGLEASRDPQDAAQVLSHLAVLEGGAGLGLVRPLVAEACASLLQRLPWPHPGAAPPPAALAFLCAYLRRIPPDEACRFVVDWAGDCWGRRGPAAAGFAAAALQIAGLTLSRVMGAAGRPPFDKEVYNRGASAARDLFLQLARVVPPGELRAAPVLAAATENAAVWGFEPADTARLDMLVRICRDFGRSVPRTGNPGAAHLT